MAISAVAEAAVREPAPGADPAGGLAADDLKGAHFAGKWLSLQCSMIDGAVQGLVVLGTADAGPFEPVAFWPEATRAPSALLADVAQQSLEGRRPLIVRGDSQAVLSCPVTLDGQLHGLVAVETALQSDGALQEQLSALRWGLYGIEAALRSLQSEEEQDTRERLIATLDLVASALSEDRFHAAAQVLATDLAIRLDCDRVSIGFVRDRRAAVVAISHSAEFGERMNLTRAIASAMDEAIDQKSMVVVPEREGDALVTRDHAALAREFGSDSVVTIPFSAGEASMGAFTFERPRGRPFDDAAIELCQAVVAVCSRILETKRLNDRPFFVRTGDAARTELSRVLGPRHFGRKLAALAVMAAAVFFSFATYDYRVGSNATLEGSVRRVLVAPYDGYVVSAAKRAGDLVSAGTVLATLDDRELRLEYYKWASQRAQYGKQYQEAVAQRERAQGSIVLAQMQQAEAQMNLLAEQLGRTKIAAPFDGLVVSGDLNQSLGSAVKRGQVLFEVSPLNAYRVVLDVDESEITSVKEGQAGKLLLTSIPGEEFPFTVTHLTPIAVAKEGRSYYRVEAMLARASDRLRPGMEGVAKIEVGERKLLWILSHKLVDWLHLSVWTWL